MLISITENPLKQATYEISGTTEPDIFDPANPGATMPVKATYVITPRQLRTSQVMYGFEDWGVSSDITLEIGDTVISKSFPIGVNQPTHYIEPSQYVDDLRIHSFGLTVSGSMEPVMVDLNLMGGIEGSVEEILSFKKAISLDSFMNADMQVNFQGVHKQVHIDSLKLVSEGCGVSPELVFSQNNQYFEPVYLPGSQEMVQRIVVPSSGGRFYVTGQIDNKTGEKTVVRRWYQLTLPNGQTLPVGGYKAVKLYPGTPFQEIDKSIYIDKRWPDGVYILKMMTMGRDSLIPEETDYEFRKGSMEQFVPPIN